MIDQKTGRTLLALNPQKMFDPGSTMKLYFAMVVAVQQDL